MRHALVCMCGLPASGKSRLARAAAAALGAQLLRSDTVRKELVGLAPTEHYHGPPGTGPYDEPTTDATYAELARRAEAALARYRSVVVDASNPTAARRAVFLDLAARTGATPIVVWLTIPDDRALDRLAARALDPDEVSDADAGVYRDFQRRFVSPIEVPPGARLNLDGSLPTPPLIAAVLARLQRAWRESA